MRKSLHENDFPRAHQRTGKSKRRDEAEISLMRWLVSDLVACHTQVMLTFNTCVLPNICISCSSASVPRILERLRSSSSSPRSDWSCDEIMSALKWFRDMAEPAESQQMATAKHPPATAIQKGRGDAARSDANRTRLRSTATRVGTLKE